MGNVMKVTIRTPEVFLGDIIGDLNKRSGIVVALEDCSYSIKQVTAKVPKSELKDYTHILSQITNGRAFCSIELEDDDA